jgi:hypothetical protein
MHANHKLHKKLYLALQDVLTIAKSTPGALLAGSKTAPKTGRT